MMMLMFSMAGVPFFVGFFAKFSVLQAVVAAGYMKPRHRCRDLLADRRLLLPACRQDHVAFDQPSDTSPIEAPLNMKVLASANGLPWPYSASSAGADVAVRVLAAALALMARCII